MDVGEARGLTVSPLESGEWAWTAWIAGHLVLSRRTGIEASEAAAQQAGTRALEHLVSEAAASARSRRELPQPEKPAKQPEARA